MCVHKCVMCVCVFVLCVYMCVCVCASVVSEHSQSLIFSITQLLQLSVEEDQWA